jgi:hypothetical protein
VRWLWFFSSPISSFSSVEFSSKISMLNFSKFFGGIRFSILVGEIFAGGGGLAISIFWSMC